MNKLFNKIATITLGLAMAIGVGVAVGGKGSGGAKSVKAAAPGTGYTKITSVSSLSTGDKVIIYNDSLSSGVTGMNTTTNKDVTISTTASEWIKYDVTKGSSNFTLKTGTNYIYAVEKTIKYDTSTATNFTVNSDGVFQTDTSTPYLLQANSSYYRPYKANAGYSKFFVYKVTTYTVTYDKNAGSDTVTGMPNNATGVSAGSYTLSTATPSRSGYTFLGWGLTSGATQTVTSITVDGNETVYAIWQVSGAPAVTVSPTSASGYRGQTVTLTATPNEYITPTKYIWTTTDSSIAKLGSSSATSVETATGSIVVTYGGDSADSATVTVKGVDEVNSKVTAAVSCDITVTASTHALTISPNTAQSIAIGGSFSVTATSTGSGAYSSTNVTAETSNASLVTVDGTTSATKSSGSSFTIAGVAAGNATITFSTTNGDEETLSVSVEKSIYGTYQLCTSDSDLEEGAFYIIGTSASDGNSVNFMSTANRSNNKTVISASVSNSQVEVEEVQSGENVMVVKLGKSGDYWTLTTKNYTLASGESQGYLGSAGSNNYLKLLSSLTDNGKFDISINSSTFVMTAEAQAGNAAFIRYNSGNNPPLISCYTTASSQSNCYLYKMVDIVPIDTLTIPSTYGASTPYFYEGQNWTVEPTYNDDATTKTSELQIVSGGDYIEIDGLTVTAKVGVMSGSTATAVVKAHATDVEDSTVYSQNCTITITKAAVTNVAVTTAPSDLSYVEGQTLDLTGMVTTLTWNYGGTTTVSGAADGLTTTPSLSTHLTVADHNGIEVSVTYLGTTSSLGYGFTIEVVAKSVTTINSWTDLTTTYPIGATLDADGTINVGYNDGSNSDFDVAELWSSGLATFKLDGTTVTPGTTTLSASDNGKNLTIYYSNHQKSVAITVKNINYQFLTRIEDTSALVAGETYVIVGRHNGTAYVMTSEVVSKPAAVEWTESWSDTYKVEKVDYTVDSLRADVATWGWTLGGSTGEWTFTGADGKSLSYSSGTDFNSTGTSTWTIGYSGVPNSGYWKIANTSSTSRVVTFREGSTLKFAPYANTNPQSNIDGSGEYHYVELYRVLDAANTTYGTWSDTVDHIDEISCHSAGSYDFDTGKSWSTMASAFDGLDIEVRAYFKHASYTYNGNTTTGTYGTDSDVASFVCKYDYIIDKYGWTDFIGRDGTTFDLFNSGRFNLLINITKNTNVALIVIITSVISVAAVGGYFFLRKKKEQ